MAITFRDFFEFPFNDGRGIRAHQIADVDLPVLDIDVFNIKNERLGYIWYYSVKNGSVDFVAVDFLNLVVGSRSPFITLTTPEVTEDEIFFGAFAVPLDAPEPKVSSFYWRVRNPIYIDGAPFRMWVSDDYLHTYHGEREITIEPQLRLSRYFRYITTSAGRDVPVFNDTWKSSVSPILELDDFLGIHRYVHIVIPHGTVTPDIIMKDEEGANNIAEDFTMNDQLIFINNNMPHAVYTSDTPLDNTVYSGENIIVLPERRDIVYSRPLVDLPEVDVGFTWYMGSVTVRGGLPFDRLRQITTEDFAERETSARVSFVESTVARIRFPDPLHRSAIRFIIQPATAPDPTGIWTPIFDPNYETIDGQQEDAETLFNYEWSRQFGDDIDINGVPHSVWLNGLYSTFTQVIEGETIPVSFNPVYNNRKELTQIYRG